ncbi:LuxR family transcriptional regulator (plasmid) [Rhizobium sp. WL3]|uniref:helix-turn-helix transcriptional regulator n=1 Tax=Rhizobium sp. WL3 TaxID=2603277 RepID=UPI0011C1F389|nr:autoinducer binding domain-containing protein [Rhizobium sp. WL3]QEE43347.1 LuxR family transcriptional regulator [Rhizobium sp. WL3]
MTVQFRTLLDMVDTAVSGSAISRAMNSFALGNGFANHAFLELHGAGARYIGDYPDTWEHVYLAERLFRLDPVIAQARRRSGHFFWAAPDWFATRNGPLKRFATNAIEHGVTHGLTISARAGFDRQLLLSFANASGDFRKPKQQDLDDAVPVLMALYYRLSRIGEYSNSAGRARLSSGELLCLTWAAKGKTAVEIGLITRLSTRTVQHYLDSARAKLGAATVPHLVAISKDIKLI